MGRGRILRFAGRAACLTTTLVLAASVAMMLAPSAAAETRVQIESGTLIGEERGGVRIFRGIRYAAPVTGANRWRAPQPVERWVDAFDATEFGLACPQPKRRDRDTGIRDTNEDCLTLNVWAAEDAKDAPVMVWIHGGAFRLGSGSQAVYAGDVFAREGVVLVTINYRLGRLGIFAHPALEEGGNFALMDQVAALDWVERNIAAFGGDPGNVTVFGESAGGSSILHLLTSPRAAGRFHKAIIQSGGGHQVNATLREARATRPSLISEGVKLAPAEATAKALRALGVDAVLAQGSLDSIGAVAPVIDGDWVPDDPGHLLAKGLFHKVPVLVGANSFEASVLTAFGTTPEAAVAASRVDLASLDHLYRGDHAAAQAWGDAAFVAGARHIARAVSDHGGTSYLYHFDYVLERRRDKVPGAGHGADVIFVFNNLAELPYSRVLVTQSDRVFADAMQAAWIRFARSGDPNGGGLPHWPAYDAQTDQTFHLGAPMSAITAFRKPQLDFHQQRWERLQAALADDAHRRQNSNACRAGDDMTRNATADREFLHSRWIDAPRPTVFNALSNPQHLARWWGPNGFSSTFESFEFEPGGRWRFVMHAPDGAEYRNESIFREIVAPERVVIEHLAGGHHFLLTICLTASRNRTRVDWRQVFDTAEHRDEIAPVVVEANEQNLDRLQSTVAELVRAPI